MHKTKPIRHSSRSLLLTGSLLLVTAAVGLGAAAEPSARKPNFIFILTDDMSWADVACFGHPYAKTPNVDRMAKEGIKFTQFYACAQECAPARSALLTGRLPAKAGKLTNNGPGLDPAVPNVNKLLKTAGYATGHFGKWHLADGFKDLPVTNSLSEYGIDESWLASNNGHNADTARLTTDAAIRFIEERAHVPFHMFIWYVWPHTPTNPSAKQKTVYSNLAFNIKDCPETTQRKFAEGANFDIAGKMTTYLATVTEMDKQVGRLLARLDELNLARDTLVAGFAGDQGADKKVTKDGSMWVCNPGPYRGGKFDYNEGGIRTTCVAQWKGRIPAGLTNDSLWRTVDWLPTVCAQAGVKTGTLTLDGQNVADIVLGNKRERTEPLFWGQYNFAIQAMREGRRKMVQHSLYDLATDPGEQTNLTKLNSWQNPRMVKMYDQWAHRHSAHGDCDGRGESAACRHSKRRGGLCGGWQSGGSGDGRNGWHFTGWSDGDTTNPRTVVVPASDSTYTANFAR